MYASSLPSLPEDTLPGWKVTVEKLPKTGDRDDYVVIARPECGDQIFRNNFSISHLEKNYMSFMLSERLKMSVEEIKKAISVSEIRTRIEIPILDRFLRVGLGVV